MPEIHKVQLNVNLQNWVGSWVTETHMLLYNAMLHFIFLLLPCLFLVWNDRSGWTQKMCPEECSLMSLEFAELGQNKQTDKTTDQIYDQMSSVARLLWKTCFPLHMIVRFDWNKITFIASLYNINLIFTYITDTSKQKKANNNRCSGELNQ